MVIEMTIRYVHRGTTGITSETEELKQTIEKARNANIQGKKMYEDAVSEVQRLKSELAKATVTNVKSSLTPPVKPDLKAAKPDLKAAKPDLKAAKPDLNAAMPDYALKAERKALVEAQEKVKSLTDQVSKLQSNKNSTDELNTRLSLKKEQLERRIRDIESINKSVDMSSTNETMANKLLGEYKKLSVDLKTANTKLKENDAYLEENKRIGADLKAANAKIKYNDRVSTQTSDKLQAYKCLIENTCKVMMVAIQSGCSDNVASNLRDAADTLKESIIYI